MNLYEKINFIETYRVPKIVISRGLLLPLLPLLLEVLLPLSSVILGMWLLLLLILFLPVLLILSLSVVGVLWAKETVLWVSKGATSGSLSFLLLHSLSEHLLLLSKEIIQEVFAISTFIVVVFTAIRSSIMGITTSLISLLWLLLLLLLLRIVLPVVSIRSSTVVLLAERVTAWVVLTSTVPWLLLLLIIIILLAWRWCIHSCTVILRLLILIAENVISGRDLLELLRGLPLILVRVILLCQLVIRYLYILLRWWGRHTQYLVIVLGHVEVRRLHSKHTLLKLHEYTTSIIRFGGG